MLPDGLYTTYVCQCLSVCLSVYPDGESVKPVDVVVAGLNTILPLMTNEILKVSAFYNLSRTPVLSLSSPPDTILPSLIHLPSLLYLCFPSPTQASPSFVRTVTFTIQFSPLWVFSSTSRTVLHIKELAQFLPSLSLTTLPPLSPPPSVPISMSPVLHSSQLRL